MGLLPALLWHHATCCGGHFWRNAPAFVPVPHCGYARIIRAQRATTVRLRRYVPYALPVTRRSTLTAQHYRACAAVPRFHLPYTAVPGRHWFGSRFCGATLPRSARTLLHRATALPVQLAALLQRCRLDAGSRFCARRAYAPCGCWLLPLRTTPYRPLPLPPPHLPPAVLARITVILPATPFTPCGCRLPFRTRWQRTAVPARTRGSCLRSMPSAACRLLNSLPLGYCGLCLPRNWRFLHFTHFCLLHRAPV